MCSLRFFTPTGSTSICGRWRSVISTPKGCSAFSTAEMMALHTAAVARGARAKFIVGDLPEVVEDEVDGDQIPQQVTLPVTVNGRIFPRADVDFKPTETQHIGFLLPSAPPQNGAEPRQHLARLERLGQDAVAANFFCPDGVHGLERTSQEDHRNGREFGRRLDVAGHFVPVLAGHPDVGQDDVRNVDDGFESLFLEAIERYIGPAHACS